MAFRIEHSHNIVAGLSGVMDMGSGKTPKRRAPKSKTRIHQKLSTGKIRSKSRKRLIPPKHKDPSKQWAEHKTAGGPTRLELLLQEIQDACDQKFGPPQVAILLNDNGKRYPWGTGGDMPEYSRDPWKTTAWIGAPSDAKAVLRRILKAPGVGEVLRRGAEIQIEHRGDTDFDEQREETTFIRKRWDPQRMIH